MPALKSDYQHPLVAGNHQLVDRDLFFGQCCYRRQLIDSVGQNPPSSHRHPARLVWCNKFILVAIIDTKGGKRILLRDETPKISQIALKGVTAKVVVVFG